MKKEDLRIRKTKQSIKESFIELVEIKGYKHVSVTDIVKKANINRNTFYLHYDDKEDLIKNLIADASVQMQAALGSALFLKSISFINLNETYIRWGFRNILKLVEPDVEFYRIVLMDESLNGYLEQLFSSAKKSLAFLLNVKNPRSNLIYEYTMSGMFGLLKQWILYSPTSIAETAKILAELAYTNLQKFKHAN